MRTLREELAREARANAERVREALADLYPEAKFRVVGHRRNYWRVTVSWTDGPGVLALRDDVEHAAGVQVSVWRTVTVDLLAWVAWNGREVHEFEDAPTSDLRTPEFEVFSILAADRIGGHHLRYRPGNDGVYRGVHWAQDRVREVLRDIGGRRGCELLAQ